MTKEKPVKDSIHEFMTDEDISFCQNVLNSDDRDHLSNFSLATMDIGWQDGYDYGCKRTKKNIKDTIEAIGLILTCSFILGKILKHIK